MRRATGLRGNWVSYSSVGTVLAESPKRRHCFFIPFIPSIPVQKAVFNRDEGDANPASASLIFPLCGRWR